MTDISELDRAMGVLAGLAIGDALGRPVEGLSPLQIREKYGSITSFLTERPGGSDDTEYAIATALTLIKYGRNATAADFATFWQDNICQQDSTFLGAGFSEMLAISNLKKGLTPPLSGVHIHSWSDGLAMRVAPSGIVARYDLHLAKKLAIADGQVSHAGEGIESGIAIAVAISLAMAGNSPGKILVDVLKELNQDTWTFRAIQNVLNLNPSNEYSDIYLLIDSLVERVATHDYAFADLGPEAVSLAFSALHYGQGDFARTLLFAVNLGRDADTIAAMAGAIVGGLVGYSGIPEYWRENLLPVNGTCLSFTAGIDPISLAEELLAL